MKNKSYNQGFTLIEVMIYIALFSLLIGTAFTAAYQLIDGSGKLSTKNTTQEEGNFVMRKLDWALTGVQTITTPSSGTSTTLRVTKYDGTQVDVCLDSNKIKIREGGGAGACSSSQYSAISTDNVSVSSLSFTYLSLGGITATFVMDGTTFTITKYFRK